MLLIAGDEYKIGLQDLGKCMDIHVEFDVNLLYAQKYGSSEAFADTLARRHVTEGKAPGELTAVLDAPAQEVGLDPVKIKHMLVDTHDSVDDV